MLFVIYKVVLKVNKVFDKPITEIIKSRTSIRTYSNSNLDKEVINSINNYIEKLSNPLNNNVRIKLIEIDNLKEGQKLGTYGVIKGARYFLGAVYKEGKMGLEALGYEFESLILYVTSLGLGSCWIGGTFNKGQFSDAMEIKEDEKMPIISPIGVKAEKRSLLETIMKAGAGSSKRRDFSEIFFHKELDIPLIEKEAGKYYTPLEMVRLVPSAVNKQPWRAVVNDVKVDFYRKVPGRALSKVDMGIALCHFHLTCIEEGIEGEFKHDNNILSSDEYEYVTSWIEKV